MRVVIVACALHIYIHSGHDACNPWRPVTRAARTAAGRWRPMGRPAWRENQPLTNAWMTCPAPCGCPSPIAGMAINVARCAHAASEIGGAWRGVPGWRVRVSARLHADASARTRLSVRLGGAAGPGPPPTPLMSTSPTNQHSSPARRGGVAGQADGQQSDWSVPEDLGREW